MWVSSHTSARTDRAQLVLELKKGSAMTKHWSLYHYRQGKPVKRRLEYQANLGGSSGRARVGRKGRELANIVLSGIIEVGLTVQFQSLRQSEILKKDL